MAKMLEPSAWTVYPYAMLEPPKFTRWFDVRDYYYWTIAVRSDLFRLSSRAVGLVDGGVFFFLL